MRSRITTVLSVAVAMALPVGGALAQSGSSDVIADASADASADVDVSADGAADVSLGANASATAQAAIDAAPARDEAPETDDAPQTDEAPVTDSAPDGPVTDVASVTDARPQDRPADRPVTDRPQRQPRHETFPVGEAGAVTVWWTPERIVDLEVRAHEGWRYHAERDDRGRTVHVAFWSGTHGYLFTAHVTDDGALRTHVEKRERDIETRTERFEVGRAGVVAVTYSVHGIHDVEVEANDGWRHRIHRQDRRTVQVAFGNGEVAYLFTAHVTEDGELRTHVQRRDLTTDERERDGTSDTRIRDGGSDADATADR